MRQSGRTRRRQGNPGFITKGIVCEESIAATEIGFATRRRSQIRSLERSDARGVQSCALPVAPGKMAILAVKLLGNDFDRAKQTNQRRSHEFSSHLCIFDIRRAALRAKDKGR